MAPVAEGRRKHADDLVRLAVEPHAAADDARVAAELRAPVAVADDEDVMISADFLVGGEAAAELEARAEHGKEVCGDAQADGGLGRLAGVGDAGLPAGVTGELAVAADGVLDRACRHGRKAAAV